MDKCFSGETGIPVIQTFFDFSESRSTSPPTRMPNGAGSVIRLGRETIDGQFCNELTPHH